MKVSMYGGLAPVNARHDRSSICVAITGHIVPVKNKSSGTCNYSDSVSITVVVHDVCTEIDSYDDDNDDDDNDAKSARPVRIGTRDYVKILLVALG